MGFLPEALTNYLVRLGWSHGDDEIFSREEMIQKFDINNIGRSPSVFNMDKLLWLNAHYIKTGDPERLAGLLLPFLAERKIIPGPGAPKLSAVIRTLQERSRTLLEMADAASFYYRAPESYDQVALAKFDKTHLLSVFSEVGNRLETFEAVTAADIDVFFKQLCDDKGWKMPQVGQPVRIALSGSTQAPGIAEIITALGKAEAIKRIDMAKTAVTQLSA
jgi:glutamyl-tRNA synthetase